MPTNPKKVTIRNDSAVRTVFASAAQRSRKISSSGV